MARVTLVAAGLAVALVHASVLAPSLLLAQGTAAGGASTVQPVGVPVQKVDRRLRFSVLGALTGGAMATGYYYMSERGTRAGRCKPFECALPYLSISGAFAGLFMARELDALKRASAPRVGDAYTFRLQETLLPAPPVALDVRDSLVAVVSDSGAQLVPVSAAPKALRRRASGLRDLRAVALQPSAGTLLVGSGTSLWETSVESGPASRVFAGAVDALASAPGAVLSASGTQLRLRTGHGPSARVDSLDLGTPVRAATHDAVTDRWWVGTDSTVVELRAEAAGLVVGRRLAVDAPVRAIASSGEHVAAALGESGVALWRREALAGGVVDPARVRGEPRFAFDLAFLAGDLYVAGGVDGLFRVSTGPVPAVLGSSRQFPFATLVRAADGVLWVGDRANGTVVRVELR